MNHELLKSIIYDQHELIQNATIVAPTMFWLVCSEPENLRCCIKLCGSWLQAT